MVCRSKINRIFAPLLRQTILTILTGEVFQPLPLFLLPLCYLIVYISMYYLVNQYHN